MVKVKEDLTGKTFGRLTVLEQAEDRVDAKGNHHARWLCECSCNEKNRVVVDGANLKKEKGTKSCGCLAKEIFKNGIGKYKNNKYQLNLEDEYGLYGIGYCSNTGREFYFDMDDYDKIKDYCWSEHRFRQSQYSFINAVCRESHKIVKMHYLIVGKYYDHIDRNSFNNRKHNLRKCTYQENCRNRSMTHRNTSGFIGVYWYKNINRWCAGIAIDRKHIHLGTFKEKEDAIRARLEAEVKYFGEFAPQRHLFEQYEINVKEEPTDDLLRPCGNDTCV
jgi:hypothetical protein